MLKIDFINAAALPGRRANPKLTRTEALRAGLEAIRLGAGEDAFLLGSGCPFGPAIGVVDAMRIGPDTAPSWEPYFHWLPWVRPLTKKNPSIPSLRNALRNTLNLSSLHQRWWWNDPDCLLARDLYTRKPGMPDLPHLTEAEVQSAVSLVGLSGGMLVSSDDLQQLSPERKRWVSRLVPNLGMRGKALDLLERELPSVYKVRQQAAGQSWQLVAVFNWTEQPVDVVLRFNQLGYPPGARLLVFDYWQEEIAQTEAAEMVYQGVPPHGCKLLRVCEVSDQPQLGGDTLHISMGAELESLRIAGEKIEIDTINMGRKVEGQLWMRLDRVPGQVMCNGKPADVKVAEDGIYAMQLQFLDVGRIKISF
jgi:alpha-galactosidase